MNFVPINANYDSTTKGISRCILQSLLWASRKAYNSTTTSTKLNLTNTILPQLQVYKTPITDYDVVNKNYLNNYKYYKVLTTTDFFVYVDLTKMHSFSIITNTTLAAASICIVYFFPINGANKLYYKVFYYNNGEASQSTYLLNNGTSSLYYDGIIFSLVNGLLKIYAGSGTYYLYEN